MDIEELKNKFLHKSVADVKDVDLALRAAPFLIREVVRLEEELQEAEKRIQHISAQFRKQPPLSKKGKKGEAEWNISLDDKKNRLYVTLMGKFDHRSGKLATNHLNLVLENVRKQFDVVFDITLLSPDVSNRANFHLRKAVYTLNRMGVKSVVRVVDPKVNYTLSILEERNRDVTYRVFTVNCLRDAELTLDNEGRYLKT